QTFGTLGEELSSDQPATDRPEFSVNVQGTPRNLTPLLRDEIYRISCEAMRNAFTHAGATRIEVEIRYDAGQFRVRVRDDVRCTDPKLLVDGGGPGHFVLPGMRERARLSGGSLAVWSEIDSGTEVEVTIPAALAYVKTARGRRLFSAGGTR